MWQHARNCVMRLHVTDMSNNANKKSPPLSDCRHFPLARQPSNHKSRRQRADIVAYGRQSMSSNSTPKHVTVTVSQLARSTLLSIILVSHLLILPNVCRAISAPTNTSSSPVGTSSVINDDDTSKPAASAATAVEYNNDIDSTSELSSLLRTEDDNGDGADATTVASVGVTATFASARQSDKLTRHAFPAQPGQSQPPTRFSYANQRETMGSQAGQVFDVLFKKKPYTKNWSVEQKWDDLFGRFVAIKDTLAQMITNNLLRDVQHYIDVAISHQCKEDLKFVQSYSKHSTNMRWLFHMIDASGKNEPGMLTGNMAFLGHARQCIRIRAPTRFSNHSFEERHFEQQTELLGERFRGKYCLVSVRPVMPERPKLVSRFTALMNESILSNVSYAGEDVNSLRRRRQQIDVPLSTRNSIKQRQLQNVSAQDYDPAVPFESELYNHIIAQRNFMYSLPHFLGVCYPSSCSVGDVRASVQKFIDEKHQVAEMEFECEQEETSAWKWFTMPRLVCYVTLTLFATLFICASIMRYVLVSKLHIRRDSLESDTCLSMLLDVLDMVSLDKCAGVLFVKTYRASPIVDESKVENSRSTSIDALKGALILALVYSNLTTLGQLPVFFMWSKWADAMIPFYRSLFTQIFLNSTVWTEAFYIISAYIISVKMLENGREQVGAPTSLAIRKRWPALSSYVIKRYLRLVAPLLAFMLLNYIWPRLSNGYVMQDQANKIMAPCDKFGWQNLLLFHNYNKLDEMCLWPSHVSAVFFQLHLLAYPILLMCLKSLDARFVHKTQLDCARTRSQLLHWLTLSIIALCALIGTVYSALVAAADQLIVPFLVDYLDENNYRRVIEAMLLPAHNHVTAYMVGIALAYSIVRNKMDTEIERAAMCTSSEWLQCAMQVGGSLESIRTSSTQALYIDHRNQQPQNLVTARHTSVPKSKTSFPGAHPVSLPTSVNLTQRPTESSAGSGGSSISCATKTTKFTTHGHKSKLCCLKVPITTLAVLVMFSSLTASWYWNGLGQPMSSTQTIFYVCFTKLAFSASFAHLFVAHVATRKNSTNPWMVTRFLVPIGRMSLMSFYVGYLVIWFDLLSSPNQWYPSHYFVLEKWAEIMFETLILSMFAYGAFEGIGKRIQYGRRQLRAAEDEQIRANHKSTLDNGYVGHTKRFEHFFKPTQ